MTKKRRSASSNGLLIDANLWLLMIIGGVDEGRYIAKSNRLGAYCLEDYDSLWKLAGTYKEIWITSYIAAEVSNLIDLKGEAADKAFHLARVIFSTLRQVDTSIAQDCEGSFFIRFGLTDNSILKLSDKFDILTNDKKMLIPLYEIGSNNIIPFTPTKEGWVG